MLTIKINNQKFQIPAIRELTLNQVKTKLINCIEGNTINYLKYISAFTGIEYSSIIKSQTNSINLVQLINYIGIFDDYKKEKPPKQLVIKDKLYDISGMGLDTFGKEYQYVLHIQSIKEINEIESLQWLLAVQFGDEDDFNVAEQNFNSFESMNWIKVLSSAWFFFLHSKYTKNKGATCIDTFLINITTRIKRLKKGQE